MCSLLKSDLRGIETQEYEGLNVKLVPWLKSDLRGIETQTKTGSMTHLKLVKIRP